MYCNIRLFTKFAFAFVCIIFYVSLYLEMKVWTPALELLGIDPQLKFQSFWELWPSVHINISFSYLWNEFCEFAKNQKKQMQAGRGDGDLRLANS